MAYGLRVNDSNGNEWLDSETAFGFIEIVNAAVSGTSNVTLSGTLPGYTAVYPVYTPADVDDTWDNFPGFGVFGGFTPSFTVSQPTGGTGAWSVTLSFNGSGTSHITGGRLLVFAH